MALGIFRVHDGDVRAIATFTSYSRRGEVGIYPWGKPVFWGSSVAAVTALFLTRGIDEAAVTASLTLTHFRLFNVTATSTFQMDLASLPQKGVIVYDETTGAIKLLHQVSGLSNEELPDNQALEKSALRLAQELVKESFRAAALPIDLTAFKEGAPYKVDLASRTLKELPGLA